MIAKLIAVGATRESAIARMRRALGEYLITGNQDDDSVSQRHHAQRRFPQRQLRHRLCRPDDELRYVRATAFERPSLRLIAAEVEVLARARLYAILDLGYVAPDRAEEVTQALLQGGADLIQLRGKEQTVGALAALAEKLHRLTSAAGVPLIINDHPEIARDVAVEGLHLGQDDLAIAAAREIVRRKLLDRKIDAQPGPGDRRGERKAPTTSASVRSLPPRPSLPTNRSGPTTSAAFTSWCSSRFSALAESSCKISPQVLAAGAKRVVIVSGLLQSADVAAATRAAKRRSFQLRNLKTLKLSMSVLVVGSIALDTVKTPVEEHADQLGGSASYAAVGREFFRAGQTGRSGGRRFSRIGI